MIKRSVLIRFYTGVLLIVISTLLSLNAQSNNLQTQQKGSAMTLLPAIEIETKENPDATVIWLHGLGADGNDFVPIVDELRLPENLRIRFIFPHAPSIPVTINGGYVMPAWYDILEMQIEKKVDIAQLMISAKAIEAFVEKEIKRGIDSKRIILAGFSQGGAVAYQVALSFKQKLGGLLALSSYLATEKSIALSAENRGINIEIHHGLYDPVVPENLGKHAYKHLHEKGYEVQYKNYPMEHSVNAEQINDISTWIQDRLK